MEIPRTFSDFRRVLAKAMTDASVRLEPVAEQLRYLDLQEGEVVTEAWKLWQDVHRRTQTTCRFQYVEPREVMADHSPEVHDLVVDLSRKWVKKDDETDIVIKTAAAVEQRWITIWGTCG